MGNWFYGFILVGLFLATWITTQELMVAVLIIDMVSVCLFDKIPVLLWPLIAVINIFAISKTLFYKPFSPKYNS